MVSFLAAVGVVLVAPAAGGYVHHAGYIPLGNDCFNMTGGTTLNAALTACNTSPCCQASAPCEAHRA